jgi:hypothetical protein
MSHEVAYEFINEEISLLRLQSRSDLVAKIGKTERKEFLAHDGNRYLLETEVFWDSRKGGDIRVMVCADGGGVSAILPACNDFIMAPDGTIIGRPGPREFSL